VGVLRALEREGIHVDVLVGTSIGAILGGAYLAIGDVDVLERRVREVLSSEEFRKNGLSFLKETRREHGGLFFSFAELVRRGIFFGVSNLRQSFISAEQIARSLAAVIPDVTIEDLDRPFAAVALDLATAEEVILRGGGLRQAAAASAAIPGVLPPVDVDGRLLIDGGWVDKIPVVPAFKLGADLVVAVDIAADIDAAREYRRGASVMVRANALKDAALSGISRRMADLLIEPAVKDVHWADFGAYERCIMAGDAAATEAVPGIRELLRRERWLSLLRAPAGKRLANLYLRRADKEFCEM
jgi:NTE family protein